MTHPFTTAPADTARAMHAAEMKGHDMQDNQDCTDCEGSGITHQTERYCTCAAGRELARYADGAPEQIWAAGGHYWPYPTFKRDKTSYTRDDLCITEAECQRRIDAAVQAEREAWRKAVVASIAPERAAAIRARGQK